MLGCHHPGKGVLRSCCASSGGPRPTLGVGFALEWMRDARIIPTASSTPASAAPPAVPSAMVAPLQPLSLLGTFLPRVPLLPPLPSESCPPQIAHAKCEKLTHASPEEHLPSRRTEKENKSHKCSPARLVWEAVQRYQHNQGTRVLHRAAQA